MAKIMTFDKGGGDGDAGGASTTDNPSGSNPHK